MPLMRFANISPDCLLASHMNVRPPPPSAPDTPPTIMPCNIQPILPDHPDHPDTDTTISSANTCFAFIQAPIHRLLKRSALKPPTCSRPSRWTLCTEKYQVPNSPGLLVRNWADSRRISATIDLSRRFVSILLLSDQCHRASFAEKQLSKIAETYSVSRRLLILSAGLHASSGALLPWNVITAAKRRGIDLTEDRPCASFEITDLDYYDFVVVVDRSTKDKLMRMAEAHAHTSGGDLSDWERRIRLLCDFEGTVPDTQRSAGVPLDVPLFSSPSGIETTMEIVAQGCECIIKSLLAAGL